MKRVKAACICQTLHFMLKEDAAHHWAVKQVQEEVEHYKHGLRAVLRMLLMRILGPCWVHYYGGMEYRSYTVPGEHCADDDTVTHLGPTQKRRILLYRKHQQAGRGMQLYLRGSKLSNS